MSKTKRASKEFAKIMERPGRAYYKLARPLMRGIKIGILSGSVMPLENTTIKNRMVNDMLIGLPSFVGEIVVGRPEDPDCKRMTEMFLQQEDLIHPFIFWAYDYRTTALTDLKR